MSDPLDEVPSPSWFHALFRTARPLEKETSLFIIASALDFYMTFLLLDFREHPEAEPLFFESNPVAGYFLDWGPQGLIFFKFGIVAFVAVIAQIIATKKLRTARWLLNFATVLVACVVIYSLTLLLRHSSLLAG
jgi:hypothetical protein